MQYIDEFRDPGLATHLLKKISASAKTENEYPIMEFCGGHTHAIFRHSLPQLLPENVTLLHGPGCPVCVLPASRIDAIIKLCEEENLTLCIYPDVLKVPAGNQDSLLKARARGIDIRLIYSPLEALNIARGQEQHVVFFAIGFETTAPATAAIVDQARKEKLSNFSVYCNHVLTPPALEAIASTSGQIKGIIGPSHVSTITGSKIYEHFCQQYRIPLVIAGFEPLDILQSILMLIKQVNHGSHIVENEYRRAVSREGNIAAQNLVSRVFTNRSLFEWRGLGNIGNSALRLHDDYAQFDTECLFSLTETKSQEIKQCICPEVLRGNSAPSDCTLFARACRPDNPKGACMVSSEGACAAYWRYNRNTAPRPEMTL